MRAKAYVILAALLFVVSGGCTTGGGEVRPKAKLSGIHFGNLNRAALELAFDVKIANPYRSRMQLTNMTYSLSSKGTELVTGSAKPNTAIAVGAKDKVSLPVRVHYGKILRKLKGIEPGSRIPYKAELVLSVDTETLGRIEIPLRKKGKLTLPFVSGVTYKRILELLEYK